MRNTDQVILETVERAINRANDAGENWADFVDDALLAIGEELHEDQDFGRDHDIIARLGDGREIYCETDGSGGYGITNLYRYYDCDINGGEGGESVVLARNLSEAVRRAREWVSFLRSYRRVNDPVVLCVWGCDGETTIDIPPATTR